MGRPRKPEEEKIVTISINLKKKVLERMSEEGNPKKLIEELVKQKYDHEK